MHDSKIIINPLTKRPLSFLSRVRTIGTPKIIAVSSRGSRLLVVSDPDAARSAAAGTEEGNDQFLTILTRDAWRLSPDHPRESWRYPARTKFDLLSTYLRQHWKERRTLR